MRDPRLVIYAALDQIAAVAYAYVLLRVIPNRLPSATVHLWTIPVGVQAMAIGMASWWIPRARRVGWWIAVIGGSLVLLSTIVLIARMIASAAFLAGVYGGFGKAAATGAIVGAALVVEVVVLLPIVQVKYLLTRAGQRAFGR